MNAAPAPIRIGPREFAWGERTYVMGILNATPDSFSGDGLLARGARAVAEQARRMVDEGADLLDLGGESTRPGAEGVDADEERRRVLPAVEAIAKAVPNTPLSIDTWKAAVAGDALDAGAHWVNDIRGLLQGPQGLEMAALIAARGVPCVAMYNGRGSEVADPLVGARAGLERSLEVARAAGIPEERIVLDPGFGFGLTPLQSIELLRRMAELRTLGRPLLAGTSRKSMIGYVLDLPPEERLEGTAATVALSIANGADIVRVHDVRAMSRVARMADAVVRGLVSKE